MQRYLLLIVGSVLSIALDQWSKIWAVNTLLRPEGSTLPTDADHIRTTTQVWVDGFWNMRLAGNKGAAWSIFRDMPETWRVPFFVAISVVAVGVIFHLYRKAEHSLTRWSLMLNYSVLTLFFMICFMIIIVISIVLSLRVEMGKWKFFEGTRIEGHARAVLARR